MYAGGPPAAADLLDGYLAAAPVSREELEASLLTMLRFRWAVRVDRLAYQLCAGERAGVLDGTADRVGLHDARAELAELVPEIHDC
jgi:homoserine kinase type II